MYRLMAIAKYDERYVIPTAHVEQAHELEEMGCSLDFDDGSGHVRVRPVRGGQRTAGARWRSRPSTPCKQRQTTTTPPAGDELRGRVNLLNWDGNGTPPGLFPRRDDATDDRR